MGLLRPFIISSFLMVTILASASFLVDGVEEPYGTENIIVLFIDGARYTETFGDPNHTYIPYIWNHLRPNGTIGLEFYNRGETHTISSHASAMTGIWQSLSNDGTHRPAQRTIFELFRHQTDTSREKVWVVSGKSKLEAVSYSKDASYGFRYGANFAGSVPEYDDTATWNEVTWVMDEKHPSLMMINLAEVDIAGHDGIWAEYVNAISDADHIVYQLWQKVQSDPVYKDKTTLIVTNDHGRHDNETDTGWDDHGCDCTGCQRLMFLAIGPDVNKGKEIRSNGSLVDIAPTVGTLLDLDMPNTQGEVMLDVLVHPPPEETVPDGQTTEESDAASYIVPTVLVPLAVVLIVAAAVISRRRAKHGRSTGTEAVDATKEDAAVTEPAHVPYPMYECANCGADIHDGQTQCPGCGQEQDWE